MRLDDDGGVVEQRSRFPYHGGCSDRVKVCRVQQNRRGQFRQGGPGRRRVEGCSGEEPLPRGRVALGDPDRCVRPGRIVPAGVEEGPGCLEGLDRQVTGDELLHRGEGDRVPVLGRPPPDGGADLFPGDPDANGSQAGRDQNQPGEALRMCCRVQRREDGPGRVSQEIHALQAQMGPERIDVADEQVDAKCGGVRRIGGQPDAAGIEEDQLT